MDMFWYVQRYNFPDFDVKKLTEIRELIDLDIISDYNSNKTDVGAVTAYQHAIHKLDYFRQMTSGEFPANSIWMNIHTMGECVDKVPARRPPFDFFSPENILKREARKISDYEREQKRIYHDDFHVAMRYFSMSDGYKKTELVRMYRKKCLTTHPDKGGSAEEFLQLQKHYEILKGK